MKRIGVLSDTHGKLRDEVVEILRGCDVILHAGDINTPKVAESLKEIAPLYIVRGNADQEWAGEIPETLSEEICGLRVFMVHNKKYFPKDMGNYELAVFGHSHKYEERREENCLYLNPGSCGPRRFSQPVTMAVVEVEEETGEIRIFKKDIMQDGKVSANEKNGRAAFEKGRGAGKAGKTVKTKKVKGMEPIGRMEEKMFSVDRLRLILRDIDKGKGVSDIAAKYEISGKMTEQICRLYLTHPGIDAAGVRDKMGLPKDR